jgi:hypothetical protein
MAGGWRQGHPPSGKGADAVGISTTILAGITALFSFIFGCTTGGPGRTAALQQSIGTASLTRPAAPAADREKALNEIQSVIWQQLDAFKRNDYTGAFAFVSKAFRKEFPRDKFETMIRARFKEIARPAQIIFRRLYFHPGDTHAVLEVDVAGANARLAAVEYRMVFEEGNWKIDGLKQVDPFGRL